MALDVTKTFFKMATGWLQKATGTFAAAQQKDDISFKGVLDAAINEPQYLVFTVAAGANVDKNLNSFAGPFGTKTLAKIQGLLIAVSGAGGTLVVKPSAANALTWFFSGTAPSITISPGANGCCIAVWDGAPFTLSGSVKNLNFAASGADVTVTLAALCGT